MKSHVVAMTGVMLTLYCVNVDAQTTSQPVASEMRQELVKAISLTDEEYIKTRDTVLKRTPTSDVATKLRNIAEARHEDAAIRYLARSWQLHLEHADKIKDWEDALAAIVQLPPRKMIESRIGGDLHAVLLRHDTPHALLAVLEPAATTQSTRGRERRIVTTKPVTSGNEISRKHLQHVYDADMALKYEYLARYGLSMLGEIIIQRKKDATRDKKADALDKDVLTCGVVAKDVIGAILAISKDSNSVVVLQEWGTCNKDMRDFAIRDLQVFTSMGRAEQTSRVRAVEAIEKLGVGDSQAYATASLMNIVGEESVPSEIRVMAIKAVGAIGGKEAERLLRDVVKYGTDDQIREAAEVALKGLSSTSGPANDRKQ